MYNLDLGMFQDPFHGPGLGHPGATAPRTSQVQPCSQEGFCASTDVRLETRMGSYWTKTQRFLTFAVSQQSLSIKAREGVLQGMGI